MKYNIRKGITLLEIKDVYLLAADEEARKYCLYVKELNETGALIYRELEKGREQEEIIKKIKDEYDIEDEEALIRDIKTFTEELYKEGYLYRTEEL